MTERKRSTFLKSVTSIWVPSIRALPMYWWYWNSPIHFIYINENFSVIQIGKESWGKCINQECFLWCSGKFGVVFYNTPSPDLWSSHSHYVSKWMDTNQTGGMTTPRAKVSISQEVIFLISESQSAGGKKLKGWIVRETTDQELICRLTWFLNCGLGCLDYCNHCACGVMQTEPQPTTFGYF